MAGYIKVAVRVRPFSKRELQNDCLCALSVDGSNITLSNDNADSAQSFTYDAVYWLDNPSQEKIMHDIGEKILEESMAGFNSCLFAYGQTGTGKTHTIFGRADEPGLVPWMVIRIFRERQKLVDQEGQLLVWCSCLQIYGDRVNDLLQLKDDSLSVRDHPVLGVHVPGALQVPCESDADFHRLVAFGAKRRAIAATHMNDQSSRSHVMVIIRLQRLEGQKPKAGEAETQSELHARLNFFDLAGSERQAKAPIGSRTFLEGCAFNRGLNALNLLIRELVLFQSKHRGNADGKDTGIPYGASNLTFLMKDALAGNSKTRMVANISPSNDSLEDTICTLRFARSVQTIKTVATPNTETRSEILSSLRAELPMLRTQLQRSGGALSCEKLHLQVEEQERMIAEMEEEFSAQVERHREVDEDRDNLLQSIGMQALSFSKAAVPADSLTPCLMNMADDPALAGILLFFLPKGQQVSIGSARDNSMRITGLGISEHMCIVENRDNQNLTIRKCSEEVRASIDGQPMQAGLAVPMQHGQRIRLGRKMLLRLSVPFGLPSGAAKLSEEDLNLQPEDLEDEWELHNSDMWLAVKDIVETAAAEMTPDQAQLFCSEAAKAVQMADEATDITSLCRPHDGITFDVRVVSGPPTSVAIGVLKCSVQLYLWNMRRMTERLDAMRECCQMCMASCKYQINDLGDPWYELHPAAVQEHVTLLEARLENVQARHEQLSQSARGWILCQGSGFAQQRVLLIFISWHRACLGRRKTKKDDSFPDSPQSKTRPSLMGTDKRNAESKAESKGNSSPRGPSSPRSKGESRKSTPNLRHSPLRSTSVRGTKLSSQASRYNAEPDLSNSRKSGERAAETAGTRKKSSDGKAGWESPTRRSTAASRARRNGRSMDKATAEVKPTASAPEAPLDSSVKSSSEVPPGSSATTSIELPVKDAQAAEEFRSLNEITNQHEFKCKGVSRRTSTESSDKSLGETRTHSVSPGNTPVAVSPAPRPRLVAPEEVSLGSTWSPAPQPRAVAPDWSPSSYYRGLAQEELKSPKDTVTPARIIVASERSPLLQNRLVPADSLQPLSPLPQAERSPKAPVRLISPEWTHPPQGGSVSLTPQRAHSPIPKVRLRGPESSPPRQARVIAADSALLESQWSPPPQARVISADEVRARGQLPSPGSMAIDLNTEQMRAGTPSANGLQRLHASTASAVTRQDPPGSPSLTRDGKHGSVVPLRLRATTPPVGAMGPRTPRRSVQGMAPAFTGPGPSSPATHQRPPATVSPMRTHPGQYITVPPMQRPSLGSVGGAAASTAVMTQAVAPAATPPAPLWYAQLGPTRDLTVSSPGPPWRTPSRPSRPEAQPTVLDERRPILTNVA